MTVMLAIDPELEVALPSEIEQLLKSEEVVEL